MTEAAIIAGSLVDVRNVGTHKSVKLTIHVPEEHAMRVVEAFGWPTGVNPVSVAIAHLDVSVQRPATQNAVVEAPRPVVLQAPAGAAKERRAFADMLPAQQAGMFCNELSFQKFLKEKFRPAWQHSMEDVNDNSEDWGRDAAAETIRKLCNVKSRANIAPDNPEWLSLMLGYRLWQREPEVVG